MLRPFTPVQTVTGFYCAASVTSLQFSIPLSTLTVITLLVGWMQMGQKQKCPGGEKKQLLHHRGSTSPSAFLKQAASVSVTLAAYIPLGGHQRLKWLGFGMSWQSLFREVLFCFLLLSVCDFELHVLPPFLF